MAKKFTEKASEIMSEGKVTVTKDELGTHVTLALGKEHKKTSWGSYSPAAAYEVVIPSAGKVQLMSQNLKKGVKEKLGAAIKAALQGAKLSGAVPIVKKTLRNMDVGSLTEAKKEIAEGSRKPAKPRETGKPNKYTIAADALIKRVKDGKLSKAEAEKEVMKLLAGILK